MSNVESFQPLKVKDQSRIDNKLLTYCRNWNVDVQIISDNDFDIMLSTFIIHKENAFNRNINLKHKRFFTNPELKVGYDIKPTYFLNEPETNCPIRICIAESFSNNIGSHICYQLALIQLKTRQSVIKAYASPLFLMYYKNMILNDVKIKLMSDSEMQESSFKEAIKPTNKTYKSFQDYILRGDKILIENGLINNDGTATFISRKVKPKIKWFYFDNDEEYIQHYDKLFSAKYKASLNWNHKE